MSVHLSPLFHWSPRRHLASIRRSGLTVMNEGRMSDDDSGRYAFPWVCLATAPSAAWELIMDPEAEEGGWDLWQVALRENDHLKIRGDFSPFVREVRVEHGLPADRLWWCGWRDASGSHCTP